MYMVTSYMSYYTLMLRSNYASDSQSLILVQNLIRSDVPTLIRVSSSGNGKSDKN